jgi:biopolymer transport protein ExbD
MGGMISNDAGHSDDTPIASINVTSLIDVMFCLLIAFMVTAPMMSAGDSVKVDLPRASGAAISEEEFLYKIVSVDAKGTVFLGMVALDANTATMTEQLANNAKLKEDGMVFIQGDKSVPYERIVDVLVALKEAGVKKIGFITEPRGRAKSKGTA